MNEYSISILISIWSLVLPSTLSPMLYRLHPVGTTVPCHEIRAERGKPLPTKYVCAGPHPGWVAPATGLKETVHVTKIPVRTRYTHANTYVASGSYSAQIFLNSSKCWGPSMDQSRVK